jgi:hypothetical protein
VVWCDPSRAHANIPSVQYELPDGKVLDVGAERFAISEILFDANRPLAWSPAVGWLSLPSLPYLRARCCARVHTNL